MINTTAVSNTIQPVYSKKLLGHAVQLTKLTDYATQEELPANIGATSIRFFRPPQADLTAAGAPAALTEGTAISTFRDIAYTAVDVSLSQVGQVAKVSDIANTVGLVKYLDTAIELMGEEFAISTDNLIRDKLCHASTGLTKRYSQGLANFAAVAGATAANACIVPRDLLDAMTALKKNRAPTFGGYYVTILPPEVVRDILNNSEWREVIRTQYANKVFKGEVGEFFGCKIVEATNPFTEDETEGTAAATFSGAGTNTTGFIYTSIVTGKGSYGAVNMKKAGASLNKPQVVINDKPDKSDPLNQFITVGWKAFRASVVLNSSWGVALRSKSQFV